MSEVKMFQNRIDKRITFLSTDVDNFNQLRKICGKLSSKGFVEVSSEKPYVIKVASFLIPELTVLLTEVGFKI